MPVKFYIHTGFFMPMDPTSRCAGCAVVISHFLLFHDTKGFRHKYLQLQAQLIKIAKQEQRKNVFIYQRECFWILFSFFVIQNKGKNLA